VLTIVLDYFNCKRWRVYFVWTRQWEQLDWNQKRILWLESSIGLWWKE